MSDAEQFEKYWYKPLTDSINSDGNFDKDMFRYKDLGKQPAFLSWVEACRLKNKEIEDLKNINEKLFYALNCAHGHIDPRENKRTDKLCMEALTAYEKWRDSL